jgi:hypothetical protein
MPFSTGLLAQFIAFRLALVLYWLNLGRRATHPLPGGSEAGGAGAVGWAICVVEDLGGGAAVSSSQPPSPY